MSFDAIFDEPDICAPDDSAVLIPTYLATAARAGETWIAETRNLPDSLSVRVEGSKWDEVEGAILERVRHALGADPGTLMVNLSPADPEAADALETITEARINRAYAEQAERDAVRLAARLLISQGWTTEDAATALRMPTTRMPELLKPPNETPA